MERDEDNRIHLKRKIDGQWYNDNDFSIGEWTNLLEQLDESGVRYGCFIDKETSYAKLQETYKKLTRIY